MENEKMEMKLNHIYCGDVIRILKAMPDEYVNTIITSPPYWGLRDYGEDTNTIWDGDKNCEHTFQLQKSKKQCLADAPEPSGLRIKLENLDSEGRGEKKLEWTSGFCSKCRAWYGQLGLEPTLDLYINHLLQVTAELKRVLRKDGIMFWNHGDSYNSAGTKMNRHWDNRGKKDFKGKPIMKIEQSIPTKCMILQNFRLILKMIDEQGWILRNKIIWNKPNHMPTSVKDRFANSYEPVFMLTKNSDPIYYYNINTGLMADRKAKDPKENIDWEWRECPKCTNKEYFNVRVRDSHLNRFMEKATEKEAESIEKGECPRCKGTGKIKYSFWRALDYWFDLDAVRVPHTTLEQEMKRKDFFKPVTYQSKYPEGVGATQRFNKIPRVKRYTSDYVAPVGPKMGKDKDRQEWCSQTPNWSNIKGKNPGDVWTISTQPFPEAHFATFPEKLVTPMILAGCPQEVCKKCGKARVRITKTSYEILRHSRIQDQPKQRSRDDKFGFTKGAVANAQHQTIGWTDCGCNAGWQAGIVLDPFMGAGTVGLVAKKSGRSYVGIEIKEQYVEMANNRIGSILL